MTSKRQEQDVFNAKEFILTDIDFNDITSRIYKLAGIVLKEHKKDMVYGRLSRRIRALNLNNFTEYRAFLDSPQGKGELQDFVNALTTNLTSFYREEHHFEHFEQEIDAMVKKDPRCKIRVWCAAASTGQEPYSIAMSLDKVNVTAAGQDVKVLCTDLDTNVLSKCKDGIYTQSHLEKLPNHLKSNYFQSIGNGQYQIATKLKNLLLFKQLNLLANWPMNGPFDVIFCRNVLIYFDNETRAAVVTKMKNLLKPNGVLYLGHSEAYPLDHNTVSCEGHTIFRKVK